MADTHAATEPVLKKARLASGQACNPCRRRKQRCDGRRPACSNCGSRGSGASCIYPANHIMHHPQPPAEPRMAEFDSVVDRVSDESPAAVRREPGSSDVAAQSPDEEAFYGDSSTFDFVSKLSAAPPLQRHRQRLKSRQWGLQGSSPDTFVFGLSPGSTVSSSLLRTECEMPSREMADSLVDAYFNRVHIFYPCLHEPTFRDELDTYWTSVNNAAEHPAAANHSWLALLYMLFAYGTEFVPPTVRNGGDGRLLDALDFVAQARRLTIVAVSHDITLETVQALLLLSHYLQGTTDFNDCWNVGGLLIRTAMSIGLHIDPSDGFLSEVEKEVRKRVWAGCFIVDRTLGIKFGRPSAIPIASVKRVELPSLVDDQYITNGTTRARQPHGRPSKMGFFVQTIHQAHLIDQILNDLYLDEPRLQGLERNNDDYSQTEVLSRLLSKAVHLDGRLQSWWNNLPPHLREAPEEPDGIDFHRQRCVMSLRFLYIRLLVHRQSFLIWSRVQIQDGFVRDVALSSYRCCVLVACQAIQEVKDNFDRQRLGSLWYILYYTFTAVGILLTLTGTQAEASAAVIDTSVDVTSLQAWAMAFLERWSSSNVLAARYLCLLRRSEEQLKHKKNNEPRNESNSCNATIGGLTLREPYNAHQAFLDLSWEGVDTFPWMPDTAALDMDTWGLDTHFGNTNH